MNFNAVNLFIWYTNKIFYNKVTRKSFIKKESDRIERNRERERENETLNERVV